MTSTWIETEILKQPRVLLRKPCHLQSPETEKSNMDVRRPFWEWKGWKLTGFYPYTQVLCYRSYDLIFEVKLKLESGNQKIQYGHQAAILKVTSLKIDMLLPMATLNIHMKFEIEIPKQTWRMLRKPCRLQTEGRTEGPTDGRTTRGFQYTPPPPSHTPPPPPPPLIEIRIMIKSIIIINLQDIDTDDDRNNDDEDRDYYDDALTIF